MVIDYIITIIFYLCFGFFFYLFGLALTKKKIFHESTQVLVGFFSYTSVLAIIGILFQLLKIEWINYFFITIIWLVSCCIYSIYTIKKEQIKIFRNEIKGFIRKYWFFLLMTIIFVICIFCNTGRLWADNLTDDGYYIVKIANLPYVKDAMSMDVISGLKTSIIWTYALNTWELEMSVYLAIVKVMPTIFIRFGLSTFNFILICCGMHSLIANLCHYFKKQIKENNYQYFCFIIIPTLFSINFFGDSLLNLQLEDTWKNTSALFYGSSLVRMLGPIILLDYILLIDRIKFKDVFIVAMISVVLVSRSTIAVPLIFLFALSYLIIYLIKYRSKILLVLLLCAVFVASIIFKNNAVISTFTINRVINNLMSIISIILIGSYLVFAVIKKEKRCLYFLVLILLMFMFASLEPVNNIFENLSFFDFVSGRTLYSVYLIFYILITSILLINLFEKMNNPKKLITVLSIISFSFAVILTQHTYNDVVTINLEQSKNDTIKHSLSVAKDNMALTPDSTINVGKKLNELEKNNGDTLKVITTFDWQVVDGYAHYPALTYRLYAPNIYNYTAIFRILGPKVTTGEYIWDEHVAICQFSSDPSNEKYEKIRKILNEKKFNCIVSMNGDLEKYLKKDGYYLHDQVIDNNNANAYYIYVK